MCAGDMGIAVLDCGSCRMSVGAFTDDGQRTLLRTVLAHTRPAEVVAAKGGLSAESLACIKHHKSSGTCVVYPLRSGAPPLQVLHQSTRAQRP